MTTATAVIGEFPVQKKSFFRSSSKAVGLVSLKTFPVDEAASLTSSKVFQAK